MANLRAFNTIAKKEFKESVKSKWLVTFAITFFFLALGVPYIILGAGGFLPDDYPGMIVGTLVIVALPLIPLVSLAMSSTSIAGERETGTIEYLLAQPATRTEIFLGKYVGLLAAVVGAMTIGYGTAELLVFSTNPVFIVQFAYGLMYSALLAASALALGFVVSVVSKTRAGAIGTGLFVWFLIVVIYDVGFLGTLTILLDLEPYILYLVIANPVETTRILAVMHMAESPLRGELGGQLGYFIREYGISAASNMLTLIAVVWVIVPLMVGLLLFRSRD